MTLFSKYAFCFVAVYGHSFLDASKAVSALFASRGWTVLVTEDIVDSLMFCASVVCGLGCMLISHVYTTAVGLDSANRKLLGGEERDRRREI